MAASRSVAVERGSRSRWVLPAGLALGFALVSGAVAGWAGGWGIPHNDDWALLRITEHLADRGEFRLVGWNRASLAGQVWPAAAVLSVVGGGVVTLQVLDLLAAALAPALAYLLLRRFLDRGPAVLGALTLLGTPELWLLSTSFMTDAPAVTLTLASLLLGVVALQAPDRRGAAALLVGSLVVGLWAFTVREAAVAAPVAVALAAVVPRRGALRTTALITSAVVGMAGTGFEVWRRSLAAGDPPSLDVDPVATAGHGLESLFWLGLALAPVTLFRVARWRQAGTWTAVVGAGCLAEVLRLGLDRPFFPANYLTERGAYLSAGLGLRAALVPGWLWLGVCATAVVSAGVLLDRLAAWRPRAGRPADLALICFLALTAGGLLVEDLLGQTTYSRYLLVLPPVLAVFLLRTPVARAVGVGRVGPPALVAALCALALVLTAGTLRSDAARWRAAEELVAEGVDPMSIAAGQEWSGSHTTVVAVHDRRDARGDRAWWTGMFSDAAECWLVTMDPGPRAGYRLVRSADGVWVFRAEGAC